MKHAITSGVLGVLALAGPAGAHDLEPVVLRPGISALPFAGVAAGQPALAEPRFGLIDAPGGRHGGFMYISEQAGRDIIRIDADGAAHPYTSPFGLFGGGAFGVDLDGPTANMPAPTPGLFGGPERMYVGQLGTLIEPFLVRVLPGGSWHPSMQLLANPGHSQVQIDRTPVYGGYMYVSDWGGDASDGIIQIPPLSAPRLWCELPFDDPRYFTFDLARGFGMNPLWVSTHRAGAVVSVDFRGWPSLPLAWLGPGLAGIAFSPGDPYFGYALYACNDITGDVDLILPGGTVLPFARGLPGAAYPMFVTTGPYAMHGNPTLYIADGVGSVWMFTHCPADLNDDGLVDFADYLEFLNLYNAQNPRVDFNHDGFVDFADYLEFLNFYDAGC
ncbi:MAG: hypothetical protein IT436_11630 [Phycisphaerales bacterium]|nr:hypothetical protein [Phycisphaerales bacterium]